MPRIIRIENVFIPRIYTEWNIFYEVLFHVFYYFIHLSSLLGFTTAQLDRICHYCNYYYPILQKGSWGTAVRLLSKTLQVIRGGQKIKFRQSDFQVGLVRLPLSNQRAGKTSPHGTYMLEKVIDGKQVSLRHQKNHIYQSIVRIWRL